MYDRALESLRERTRADFAGVMADLRKDHPEVVAGAAAMVGGMLGGAAVLTTHAFGPVNGLSSAQVISGLATRLPRRLPPGLPSWAAPAVAAALLLVSAGGYVLERRRKAKTVAALRTAVDKLHRIVERLTANAEYYRSEIAELKAYIDHLEGQIHGD